MVGRLPFLAHALAVATTLAVLAPTAGADGYLWLGSEYQGEGNIYRFNLATGAIDKVVAHAGPDHWNNCAIANGSLYLGNPASQLFNKHDAYTGDLVTPGTYNVSLLGHKEDGCYAEGSLWRAAYNGYVHRLTTAGVQETTFTATSGLVGIEFRNGEFWATNYSQGLIGRLTRGTTNWTFVASTWEVGFVPSGDLGALAYDAQSENLYMTTSTNRLYRITTNAGTARAILVVDLSTVGYPGGGLPDGMGWVPLSSVGVEPRLPRSGAIELGAPTPNPAREDVSFEVRLARPGQARAGIYDLSGRALRKWDLPGLGAGQSRFHWDLRKADGTRVPPGRYFVRLEAHGETAVRAFSRVQ
jgi:hypothetical protein